LNSLVRPRVSRMTSGVLIGEARVSLKSMGVARAKIPVLLLGNS
jgi:hypothetical protein